MISSLILVFLNFGIWSVHSTGRSRGTELEVQDLLEDPFKAEVEQIRGHGEKHRVIVRLINTGKPIFKSAPLLRLFTSEGSVEYSDAVEYVKKSLINSDRKAQIPFKDKPPSSTDLLQQAATAKATKNQLEEYMKEVHQFDPVLAAVTGPDAVLFNALSASHTLHFLMKGRFAKERERNQRGGDPPPLSDEASSLHLREFYEGLRNIIAVKDSENEQLSLHYGSPLGILLEDIARRGYPVPPVYWVKRALFEGIQAHIDKIGQANQDMIFAAKTPRLEALKAVRYTDRVQLDGGEKDWITRKLAELSIHYERIMLPLKRVFPPSMAAISESVHLSTYLAELFQSPFFLGLNQGIVKELAQSVLERPVSFSKSELSNIYLSAEDGARLEALLKESKAFQEKLENEPASIDPEALDEDLGLMFSVYRKLYEQRAVDFLHSKLKGCSLRDASGISRLYDTSEEGYFYRFLWSYNLEPKQLQELPMPLFILKSFLINLKDSPAASRRVRKYHFAYYRTLYRRARLVFHWRENKWEDQELEVWLREAKAEQLHAPSPL